MATIGSNWDSSPRKKKRAGGQKHAVSTETQREWASQLSAFTRGHAKNVRFGMHYHCIAAYHQAKNTPLSLSPLLFTGLCNFPLLLSIDNGGD